jgi:hypothetical protein
MSALPPIPVASGLSRLPPQHAKLTQQTAEDAIRAIPVF